MTVDPARTKIERESVDPGVICLDPELQSRDATDERVVEEYAGALREGATFPAVVLFHDGTDYWCADGWHRVLAARVVELEEIDAEIREGTRRDALRHSLGANATHGLRRTSADKRRAVSIALADPEWAELSDREIARLCGVSHTFVAQMRRPRGGNVATPPPAPSSLVLGEIVRAASACLDHGHRGRAASEALRVSVEKQLAANLTAPEWSAALERGVLAGSWSLEGDMVVSCARRPVTAPPAADSPIPRSAPISTSGDLEPGGDPGDPAVQGAQARAEEEADGWVECDACTGTGYEPGTANLGCERCAGDGGWWPEDGPAAEIAEGDRQEGQKPEIPPPAPRSEVIGKPEKPRPSAMPPDELPVPPPAPRDLPDDQRAENDAYYTPDLHARALVQWLAANVYAGQDPQRILEPSVGGGAWLRACRDEWPEAHLRALDIDPAAPGLKLADRPEVGDFLTADLVSADLIVGNPPYGGDLVAWIDRSRELAPVVGYLLRSTFLGAAERLEWWQRRPPSDVIVVLPRPAWEGPGRRAATDRVDSLFIVWRGPHAGTRLHWLDAREGE